MDANTALEAVTDVITEAMKDGARNYFGGFWKL